ncbi:uncharacterized protein LOC130894281 isoform X2 [Diorhabda carinulata]|uniref:uncharacterized protein LOC130894281 isoform X2 n=1 Tax=Diorhabda carinulata TaxID=1163345 RepID=UPI0025A0C019|nr:uncharacterized protein LOC130894281 isoform X2 [Diorhabda carinulata]
MMRLNQIFLLLFCILGSLQGDVLDFDVDTQLSSSILKYLNERNPNFSYRSAKILQKNVEGDKLDATFQVEATCDYPCQGGTLKCESIFRKIVGESLWHIAGAICAPIESIPYLEQQKNIIPTFIGNPVSEQQKTIKEPKDVPRTVEEPKVEQDFVGEPKIVNDFIEEPKAIDVVTPKTIKNAEEPELHIEISEESPKKTVPCLGCPIDINPNAYGVADLINTALRHIESERSQKHTALKVLRVQQQVVSGIKYTLLVEVAPTVCPKTIDSPSCPIDQSRDSFICEVQFWEKSWERFTQIIKNNCTNNQEFVYNAGFYTTTKSPPREVDLSDLESQILSDFEIEQPQTTYNGRNWVNSIHPVYSNIGYGPEVILQKRRVRDIVEDKENEHNVFKRHYRDSDSDSSSSSSESDESNDKKRHNDDSDDDSSQSHKHKYDESSESCEHHHKHKHNHRDSDDREPVKDKHSSNDSDESNKSSDSSKSSKSRESSKSYKHSESSESSDSSESDDHKKKHKHHNNNRRKRSNELENDPQILDDLAWIASKILDYHNYVLVGSSNVRLNGLHYKLQLLLERDRTVVECSVFMTVNEGNVYESTIDKYHCNTDEVWKHKTTQDKRSKTLGGMVPISTNDPQINLYLKDGLSNLDKTSPHTNKYKILEIMEATKQTVSGVLYRIKAHVTISDCEKGKDTDPASCGVLKDAPIKECHFKIWDQPWLPQGRQTNITCDNDEEVYRFRQKRDTVTGGINQIPKDDDQVKLYLKDGLTNMDQVSSHANKYKVLEVLEASSQVVSGVMYRIKARITVSDCEKGSKVDTENCGVLKESPVQVCNFKIWDKPWIPQSKETKVTCKKEEAEHSKQRRSAGIPGGTNSISTDDPQIKNYLKDALTHLDQSSSHTNKYKILDVIEASRQVVSGSLYRIKAHVTVSDCEKGKDTDPATCGVLKDAPIKECHFKIWDQPWLPQGRQTNITCDEEHLSFRQRRSVNIPPHEDAVKVFFKHFQLKYSKNYPTKAEYKHRLSIFKNNLNMIDLLNKYEQGTAKYGINQFADLTQKEFSSLHGLRTDLQSENNVPFPVAEIPDIDLPTGFDWREKNAVTEVKDQGLCGSCWAFSTTGNVEGQYAIKYKNLTSLSEQELVDCDKLDEGCNGGLMDNAYRTIEKLGGLESEKEYPYDGRDEKCYFNTSQVVARITSAVNISHNETDMAKWLTKNGPIAIAINANAMQFYMGGVSHPFKIFCNPKSLDHGVLIVGYGVHTSTIRKKILPYWIVKNSWGTSWGEQGYYRVYRGDGTCGLNQTPSSAVIL